MEKEGVKLSAMTAIGITMMMIVCLTMTAMTLVVVSSYAIYCIMLRGMELNGSLVLTSVPEVECW